MNEATSTSKGIAVLGSTGSIGTQALQVIKENQELFTVEVLTANSNADLLITQALEFNPNEVVIVQEDLYEKVSEALSHTDVKVYSGVKALSEVVQNSHIDVVLTALVGYSGLLPTVNAIKARKTIALANKETLVVAGDLITQLAQEYRVAILPVSYTHLTLPTIA